MAQAIHLSWFRVPMIKDVIHFIPDKIGVILQNSKTEIAEFIIGTRLNQEE